MAERIRRRRSRSEQRHYDAGYADGYRGAHGRLQAELRAEYDAKLTRLRHRSPIALLFDALRLTAGRP